VCIHIVYQENLAWLGNYALEECVTDTEQEDTWDVRHHSELNSTGMNSNRYFNNIERVKTTCHRFVFHTAYVDNIFEYFQTIYAIRLNAFIFFLKIFSKLVDEITFKK